MDGDPDGASLVAWTTTPWTLPSNLALCVHPDMMYVKVWPPGSCFALHGCNFAAVGYMQSRARMRLRACTCRAICSAAGESV